MNHLFISLSYVKVKRRIEAATFHPWILFPRANRLRAPGRTACRAPASPVPGVAGHGAEPQIHLRRFPERLSMVYLTGLEGNQCRKARIVRNHIGCAILVWVRLKQVAVETQRTSYRVKRDLLDDYLRSQLKSPTIQMRLA
jgi:hypothetical protein